MRQIDLWLLFFFPSQTFHVRCCSTKITWAFLLQVSCRLCCFSAIHQEVTEEGWGRAGVGCSEAMVPQKPVLSLHCMEHRFGGQAFEIVFKAHKSGWDIHDCWTGESGEGRWKPSEWEMSTSACAFCQPLAEVVNRERGCSWEIWAPTFTHSS